MRFQAGHIIPDRCDREAFGDAGAGEVSSGLIKTYADAQIQGEFRRNFSSYIQLITLEYFRPRRRPALAHPLHMSGAGRLQEREEARVR
jgi:hypothetical protein